MFTGIFSRDEDAHRGKKTFRLSLKESFLSSTKKAFRTTKKLWLFKPFPQSD